MQAFGRVRSLLVPGSRAGDPEFALDNARLSRAARPMRIAVIGGRGVPSNYSGIERILEQLFSRFVEFGHEVTVFCRPGVPRQPDERYRGIRQVFVPAPGGRNGETVTHSLLSMMHACAWGDTRQSGRPFDLISMHAIAPNLAVPMARLAGIPVISHVHGLDWQRDKWRGLGSRIIHLGERAMVARSTAVVVVNRELAEYYRERYGLETRLLPNGIESTSDDLPVHEETLRRFGLTPRRFIVSIGRLVPEKRLADTIAAFSKVGGEMKLAIVGNGASDAYVDSLRRQAVQTCGDRVVFTGAHDGPALETLFRQAAFYVTSSGLEGLPLSLLECCERGTAAIASDIVPHREILGGVDGYDLFFNVGDVDALAGLMRRLIDHPEHATGLGATARRYVRREFSWSVLAARTEAFYQGVLRRVA